MTFGAAAGSFLKILDAPGLNEIARWAAQAVPRMGREGDVLLDDSFKPLNGSAIFITEAWMVTRRERAEGQILCDQVVGDFPDIAAPS